MIYEKNVSLLVQIKTHHKLVVNREGAKNSGGKTAD